MIFCPMSGVLRPGGSGRLDWAISQLSRAGKVLAAGGRLSCQDRAVLL